MKKLKLITAVIAVFVCLNFVFAGNPIKGSADNLAIIMVEKLSRDIQLTDSQKLVIQIRAKEFAQTMQGANSKTNKEEKSSTKRMAYQQYKMVLDSILTNDQKTQLVLKQKERKEAQINKSNK